MTSTSESSTSTVQVNASEGDILQQALKNIGLSQSKEQTHVLKDGKCDGLSFLIFQVYLNCFVFNKCAEDCQNI